MQRIVACYGRSLLLLWKHKCGMFLGRRDATSGDNGVLWCPARRDAAGRHAALVVDPRGGVMPLHWPSGTTGRCGQRDTFRFRRELSAHSVFFFAQEEPMPIIQRSPKRVVKNYTLDRAAVALLNELVGARKGHGAFLSRLVYVEAARQEERARMQQEQLTEMVRVID